MKTNIKRNRRIWVTLFFIVTGIRLWLGYNTPLILRSDWYYDDRWMMNAAYSIANGQWLGEWSVVTLIKMFMYPIFLAFGNKIGVPYNLLLYVFYVACVCFFVIAIKPLIKNKWALMAVYVFLLFSPVMFNYNTVQYIYRNAIVPGATLLFIASFWGMFIRRNNKKKFVFWLIFSGITLPFFWFICENSIWLGIFAFGAIIITAVYFWIEWRGKDRLFTLFLLIPVLSLILVSGIFSKLNYEYYGTTDLSLRSNSNFSEMISKILLIERGEEDTNEIFWITESMMKKACDASETLASIEDEINLSFEMWTGDDSGQIKGDFTQWVLIVAFSQAGIYETYEEGDAFCKQVCDELDAAFECGELQKTNEKKVYLSSTARGIAMNDIPEVLERLKVAIATTVTWKDVQAIVDDSDNSSLYEVMKDFLNTSVATDMVNDKLKGWVFALNDTDQLTAKIVDDAGKKIADLEFIESPDIYDIYAGCQNAQKSRFLTAVDDEYNELYLEVYLNGEYYKTFDIYEDILDEKVKVSFETLPKLKDKKSGENLVVNIANSIIRGYQMIAIPIMVLAIVSYIYLFEKSFWNKNMVQKKSCYRLWLVITGLVGCYLILMVGNAWYMSFYLIGEGFEWKVFNYGVGGTSVLQVVQCICIIKAIQTLLENKKSSIGACELSEEMD